MPDATLYCSRCRQDLPLSCYWKSEAGRMKTGRNSAVCIDCKREANGWYKAMREDRALRACYERVKTKSQDDDQGMDTLPAEARVEREQRIGAIAQRVADDGEAGDGRRWNG